jgi:excisionase family DNA binding protein
MNMTRSSILRDHPQSEPTGTTYLSVEALAAELGLSRASVYSALRKGLIPHIRIGRRFVLPKSAIAEWLRSAGNSILLGR